MKTIVLPAGTEHVLFGELEHLIADAFYPSTGDDDERMDHGICCLRIEGELSNAVKSGSLPVKDAMTLGPHPYPVGNALQTALVTVDDLREFMAGRLDVVTTEPTATRVLPAGASVDAPPNKSRRDSITPVIELAQSRCKDSTDTAEVWPQMQVLADNEHPPFMASMPQGLKYLKGEIVRYFTRGALRLRLHPELRTPRK